VVSVETLEANLATQQSELAENSTHVVANKDVQLDERKAGIRVVLALGMIRVELEF
jgi:hypothetical protein